jgi:hypothetical protein
LQVRVYDEATKTLQATLTGGIGYQRVGHSNRVFSLKFCNDYIARYFVPLRDGNMAVFQDGKYIILEDAIVRKVYFNRMPKFDYKAEDGTKMTFDFTKWFFTVYTGIRSISYELTKEVFYDDKINLCPRMKHQYVKYDTISEPIQKKS